MDESISVHGTVDQVIFKLPEARKRVVDPWPKKYSSPDILALKRVPNVFTTDVSQ